MRVWILTNLNFLIMGLISAYDFLNNSIEEVPQLIESMLPRVGLAALVGSSYCNKSTLARKLAMDIVTESESFLGFKINATHKSVLYISTEDNEESLSGIHKKQFGELKTNELTKNLKFESEVYNLCKFLIGFFTNGEEKVDLVIVDTYSDLFNGDSNSFSSVRPFLNDLNLIAQQNQCLILFVHHTGKAAENRAANKNNILGSQSFEAKMRTVLELQRDKEVPNRRILKITKGNYIPDEIKKNSFIIDVDENLKMNLVRTLRGNFEGLNKSPKVTPEIKDFIYNKSIKEEKSYRAIEDAVKNQFDVDIGGTRIGEIIKSYNK